MAAVLNWTPPPLPRVTTDWLYWRKRARSDLYFLCVNVLGYTDVRPRVHGQIMGNVQRFPEWEEKLAPIKEVGQFSHFKLKDLIDSYNNAPDMWMLPGKRNYFNMIPRAHLKTSVITFAHSIQWIINYPNIRICIDSHTDANVKGFLMEIKKHFTNNERFRHLFPEHVPTGKEINNFGNQEFFDTKARTKWRKEHTVNILSIGSAAAGPHYDVIFHDDLVDKENVITPEQISKVKGHMADCDPLLERHQTEDGPRKGWEFLTGTFYDFSDLNYSTYEDQKAKPEESRIWSINVQSAAPNWPEGPFLWPERFNHTILKAIEDDPTKGPGVLAAQYLMNPIPPNSGLVDSPDEIVFIPRSELNKLYAYLSLHVTVDLAGMEPSRDGADNDYTVINLSGFGKDGKVYVLELLRGRFRPDEVITTLFSLWQKHPRIQDFKIEKDAHARVLGHFLRREMARRNVWLPIVELKRDNRTSKQQRIKGLQAWLKNQTLKFASDLACKQAVIDEIMRFPKYVHDDILDTVSDQMQNREGGVEADVLGRQSPALAAAPGTLPFYKFIGFDEQDKTQQVWLKSNLGGNSFHPADDTGHDPLTGW
jgi:predicted phage terminase large subunit-like protein